MGQTTILTPKSKVFVAGRTGLVGSALVRQLKASGISQLLAPSRSELDLTNQTATYAYLAENRPDIAIIAAARVGGIVANIESPADFLAENVAICQNTILGAHKAGVPRLLFLASGCMYPKASSQPIPESALLTGPFEPTNEPYAIAKVVGLKLCESLRKQHGVCYHTVIPNNLYGPGDNYHPKNSHVLPGLLRRFIEAKEANAPEVVMWGTGSPLREFTYSDDLADACLHILQLQNPPDWINVASGQEISIRELASLIAEAVGYEGKITQDLTKPDGVTRKLLDTSHLRSIGWTTKCPLPEGLKATLAAYIADRNSGKVRN